VEDQELAYEGREYWMDDLGLLRAEATDDVAGNADDEIAVGVAVGDADEIVVVVDVDVVADDDDDENEIDDGLHFL